MTKTMRSLYTPSCNFLESAKLSVEAKAIVTVKEEAVSPETAPNRIWSVVSDPNIPITAKVVYAYLHRMAKNGEGEFQLGKMLLNLGISGNTARRYLRLLAQSSLIEVCHAHRRRSQSPWAFSIP